MSYQEVVMNLSYLYTYIENLLSEENIDKNVYGHALTTSLYNEHLL